MKLATLKNGTRDGELAVVSRDLRRAIVAGAVAPTMQAALDDWQRVAPRLAELSSALDAGGTGAAGARRAIAFDARLAHAPLPRAYQWVDGSAYVNHVELVRKARGAPMPPEFWTDPLMYQGGSDSFLGPTDDIVFADEAWGIDFEAEVAVVTGDVPAGVAAEAAAAHILLLLLVNDVSLRNLIPAELGKGFGFLQSKPASSFAPVAVTPDELGEAWRGGEAAPAAGNASEWRAVRKTGRGRGHDLRFRPPDRPCGEDARPRGGDHRRFGHGVEQGKWRARAARRRGRHRLFLHRRAAHGRDDPRREAVHAIPALWRPRAHRDARCRRLLDYSAPSTRSSGDQHEVGRLSKNFTVAGYNPLWNFVTR